MIISLVTFPVDSVPSETNQKKPVGTIYKAAVDIPLYKASG